MMANGLKLSILSIVSLYAFQTRSLDFNVQFSVLFVVVGIFRIFFFKSTKRKLCRNSKSTAISYYNVDRSIEHSMQPINREDISFEFYTVGGVRYIPVMFKISETDCFISATLLDWLTWAGYWIHERSQYYY